MRLLQPRRRRARRACSTRRTQAKASACSSTAADWDERWLAGSIPGWTALAKRTTTRYQSRYLSDAGRLFFNSADALVPLDTNGKEDVYEYEPAGEGSCARPRRLRRADLLGHLDARIGVPRRERRAATTCSSLTAAPLRRQRPRHQLRHLRRARLHEQLAVRDLRESAATRRAERQTAARPAAPSRRRRSARRRSATFSGPGNIADRQRGRSRTKRPANRNR